MKKLIIALDFDGTCVSNAYPEVGEDIGSVPVLKELVKKGHKLILYTMRSRSINGSRDTLEEAIDWFKDNKIPLWSVNNNPTQFIWTDSRKIYANLYIDDTALGIPLIEEPGNKPYVDWVKVRELLITKEII